MDGEARVRRENGCKKCTKIAKGGSCLNRVFGGKSLSESKMGKYEWFRQKGGVVGVFFGIGLRVASGGCGVFGAELSEPSGIR